MTNAATVDIFRRIMALKPNPSTKVLNHLDLEEATLKQLSAKLNARKTKIQELSRALKNAPTNLDTQNISKIIPGLNDISTKIQNWLQGSQTQLAYFNKTLKEQNKQLLNISSNFMTPKQSLSEKSKTKDLNIQFAKAVT